MNLSKRIQEINKRWNIPDEETYEEKFLKFKQRILNFFEGIDARIPKEDVVLFCNAMGIQESWHEDIYSGRTWGYHVIDELKKETDAKKFLRLLEIIFTLDIRSVSAFGGQITFSRQILIKNTQQALEFSGIGVEMSVVKNDVMFFPSGEKVLDEELVDSVLSFLPQSINQHFVDALKQYEINTPKSRVKSAESIRRTLEEFLRLKLQNEKGLKENVAELGKTLKEMAVNTDIKNIITQVIALLDNPFFNNNSKHRDGNINKIENEYLIYQSALLMRYIHEILP